MFGMKTNMPQITNRFDALKMLVGSGRWQQEAVGIMKHVRNLVSDYTPRSDGGGAHLADGWTLHVIGQGGKDLIPVLAVIYNAMTHKRTGKMIEKSKMKQHWGPGRGGGGANRVGPFGEYTLLEVLEYGSRPHRIFPVNGSFLAFEVDGETVFAKNVHHPGTVPYGMVRRGKAKLALLLKLHTKKWANKIRKAYKR